MADDIESLKAQIQSLTRENQRLVAENTRRKSTNRDLQGKVTTLTADLTTAGRERDDFKKKAEANPGKDSKELESLRIENRSYKHRDKLSALAYGKEIGLKKGISIDLVMKSIDWKPETDEFDEKTAKQSMLALKESNPDLFGAEASGTPAGRNGSPAPLNPAVAGLGSAMGRGTSPGPLENQALEESQLRDPVFMSEWNAKQRAGK